jgi:pyruvate formate-lyase activating enzyme-like uncharacterized protein
MPNENKKVQKTNYYSWKIGSLAKGCSMCVEGRKSVLFITGVCSSDCYFCPISDKKKNQDVIYINEMPVEIIKVGKDEDHNSAIKEVISEIRTCSSTGVGITGGDPLSRIERTVEFIKALKQAYGNDFHIHLYTPLNLVNEKNLSLLYEAGLDEIRFHPKFEKPYDKKLWDRIILAKKYDWDIGVEIPVIPGKETEIKELLDFIENDIKFLNLNELEIADNSFSKLTEIGFIPKDSLSYACKGSEELALKLLEYCKNKRFKVHYCTAKLKDKVQMSKRIMLRAKNIKTVFDIISKDGMLKKGALYLPELKPGAGYRDTLYNKSIEEKEKILEKLGFLKLKLAAACIKTDVDNVKLRLVCSENAAATQKNKIKCFGLVPAIVEEYPTFDAFEVEVEFL